MTVWPDDRQLASLHDRFTAFRYTLAEAAVSIAETEETLADTLEHVARTMPHHAERLRAKANAARNHATLERQRAKEYRSQGAAPPGLSPGTRKARHPSRTAWGRPGPVSREYADPWGDGDP
jgi:hypothetical protein